MVEAGNTIFLIEHNLEMLKACDYLIELGPGGGAMGGKVIFSGTPMGMLNCKESVTAPYIKEPTNNNFFFSNDTYTS
jgi:excinuclease UvrABC ATPase subunit